MNKILILGDLMLGRYMTQDIEKAGGLKTWLKPISSLMEDSYVIANLECVLTDETSDSFNKLYAPTSMAKELKEVGISAVSLANNHSLDFGVPGKIETQELLKVVNIAQLDYGHVVRMNDKKITLVSYCYPDIYKEWVKFEVSALGGTTDYLIVMVHAGIELFQYPLPRDVKVCRSFIDNGADLVVGSHSHCIQASEVYKGKSIFYGLGDLIFDGHRDDVWQNWWKGEAHPYKFGLNFNRSDLSKSLIIMVHVEEEGLFPIAVEYDEYTRKLSTNLPTLSSINQKYHVGNEIERVEKLLLESLK